MKTKYGEQTGAIQLRYKPTNKRNFYLNEFMSPGKWLRVKFTLWTSNVKRLNLSFIIQIFKISIWNGWSICSSPIHCMQLIGGFSLSFRFKDTDAIISTVTSSTCAVKACNKTKQNRIIEFMLRLRSPKFNCTFCCSCFATFCKNSGMIR